MSQEQPACDSHNESWRLHPPMHTVQNGVLQEENTGEGEKKQ